MLIARIRSKSIRYGDNYIEETMCEIQKQNENSVELYLFSGQWRLLGEKQCNQKQPTPHCGIIKGSMEYKYSAEFCIRRALWMCMCVGGAFCDCDARREFHRNDSLHITIVNFYCANKIHFPCASVSCVWDDELIIFTFEWANNMANIAGARAF